MFTAILLVCANGVMQEDTCYNVVNETLFETRYECLAAVKQVLAENSVMLEWIDEGNQIQFKVETFRCVNWKGVSI